MPTEPTSVFRRVLVPVDFASPVDPAYATGTALRLDDEATVSISPASLRALELGSELARAGQLRLIHATPPLDPSGVYGGRGLGTLRGAIEEIHRNARSVAQTLLESLARKYCGQTEVSYGVAHGVPLMFVLDEAERFDADLIIVPASDRGRVARFFLGSTADRVIREASCPVLVVPEPSAATARGVSHLAVKPAGARNSGPHVPSIAPCRCPRVAGSAT